MKILSLYNNSCALELFHWLSLQGHEIVLCSEPLDIEWCIQQTFDLTVSYTYRYILSKQILEALKNNAVNIHNSYLPWNRGADPNLWSIVDQTPRGVTLHYMNTELDKGDIIAQRLVVDDLENATLKSSYERLDQTAKQLFQDAFQYYEYWPFMRKKACGKGTYHSSADAATIKKMIPSYEISVFAFKKITKI